MPNRVHKFSHFSIVRRAPVDFILAFTGVTSNMDLQISSSFFWMYHIVDSFPLNSRPAAPWLMPYLSDTYRKLFFNVKHITAFLGLGTLDSTSAQSLGANLNNRITNKKAQKCKKCGTKQTEMDSRLQYRSWKSVTLLDLSWECAWRVTQSFCYWVWVQEWPWKHHKYWFWGYK